MAALFADASHHQAAIDLAAYAGAHDRIVLKATEGTGYTDPTFAARWRQAGALGLARVAYHFARNVNPGNLEWDHFLSAVDSAGGLGPRDWLCLDSEDTDTPRRAVAAAREFCARAVATGHPNGLVYTGRWYAEPNGLTAGVLPPGWRRLWLSDYTAAHADTDMPLPAGWSSGQVVARQYTDRAAVPGVVGGCDYSRVLNDWLTTVQPVPAPPPREDPKMIILRRTDGAAFLLHDRAIGGISAAAMNAFDAAGVPSADGFTDAQLNAMRDAMGDDPAAGLDARLTQVADAVSALTASVRALASQQTVAGTLHLAGDLQVTAR